MSNEKTAFLDKLRIKPNIFFIEKISFSLKLFSGHFYGHSFIKTVRGPLHGADYTYFFQILRLAMIFFSISIYALLFMAKKSSQKINTWLKIFKGELRILQLITIQIHS